MFLNLSEVPKELKIRYVVREFIYLLNHTGAVWLTHSLHSALGNSAGGNCGQPVPLAGVGMGVGFWFWNWKGRLRRSQESRVSSASGHVLSERGACSWEPGLQPEDEASAEWAAYQALLNWIIKSLLAQACVSSCFDIWSPGNIRTDTFISWYNVDYFTAPPLPCVPHNKSNRKTSSLIVPWPYVHFLLLVYFWPKIVYDTWTYPCSLKNTDSWAEVDLGGKRNIWKRQC